MSRSMEPTMQEKISPNDAVKLRASIGSITRLNPKMVLVLLAGLAVAVAVAFSVGLRVSKRQAVDAEKRAKLRHGNPPESLSFLPKTYADIQPPAVAPLEPTLPVLPELEDIKMVDEEEEKARTSGIFFNGPNRRHTSHGVQTEPANASVFKHQSATTQNGGPGSNRLETLRSKSGLEPYLKHPYTKPLSRYELKAGSVIPAALLTAINTDLPGDIVARVTEHVYDSATGRFLLVPQGATLYGAYDSLIANGQNRALVVWQRLIMPDGRSILLDGMAGVDKAGNGGLSDRVNYHFGNSPRGYS